MESIWPILSSPFTLGLGVGLLVAAFVWKGALSQQASMNREIKRLKEDVANFQQHLNTHLKITATGNDRLEKELASLKEQNETLRVNLAGMQQKPGRAELRHYHILEAAVSRMREQAPGFAQAWEQAIRQATAERADAESGLSKFIRKVVPGALAPLETAQPTLPAPSKDSPEKAN